ncbi:uncharacterized protein FTJAE_12526 [Fusarium tjaetaba]|uniref:Uncharacterized protein n=1 Tax=Fusarium tjaetaba TaxID=1567544 RepID=A0A8H5QQ13_9HYPO|nr:uncharacterized protein FTJAE_12526 [Fusarium tjaetaba]KAF5617736.1 hypothetical protein FTJAE_12526 [Fusarium tjaetaba]
MSTTVLSELEKFLKPIMEVVESNNDSDDSDDEEGGKVRFGHIQIPPYRLGKAEMIFVVSAIEKDLGIGVKDDGKVAPVILTFSELLDALRASKKGKNKGQWVTAQKPPWKKGQALPLGVVLAQ